jgi:hypothetical protein
VEAGDNPDAVLPKEFKFLNPSFEEGYLVLADGTQTKSAKFNIDLLKGKGLIVFIKNTSDTAIVIEDVKVKYIKIGKFAYYHHLQLGYLKILVSDTIAHNKLASYSLVERQVVKKSDEGYGRISTNSTTSSVSSMSKVNDYKFTRVTRYYLLDDNNDTHSSNKSGFLSLFKGKEVTIKAYVKKERVDFNKDEDLVKLFNYCISL